MGHGSPGSGRFVTGGYTMEESLEQMVPVGPSDLGFWDSPNVKRIRGAATDGVDGAKMQESLEHHTVMCYHRAVTVCVTWGSPQPQDSGSCDKVTSAKQDFTWVYTFSAALQKSTNEGRSLLIITLTTDPFSRTRRQNLRD